MDADRPKPEPVIERGADLTDEDLRLIANDMAAVLVWAFKLGLKRPAMEGELEKTLRWRLGRVAAMLALLIAVSFSVVDPAAAGAPLTSSPPKPRPANMSYIDNSKNDRAATLRGMSAKGRHLASKYNPEAPYGYEGWW